MTGELLFREKERNLKGNDAMPTSSSELILLLVLPGGSVSTWPISVKYSF